MRIRLFFLLPFTALLFSCEAPRTEKPESKQPEKMYTISAKLIRKTRYDVDEKKSAIDTTEMKIPDMKALEGTRAEYHTGSKLASVLVGFRLQVDIRSAAEDRVRLAINVEDSWADSVVNPVVRSRGLQLVQLVEFGKVVRLELDQNGKGEGSWVELRVQPVKED